MKNRYLRISVVIGLAVLAASLWIVGCDGAGSDTNPFVWPLLEYKAERTIQGGLDVPVSIIYDRYGGADGNTRYWYICNQGTVAGTGFISRVPFGQTTPSDLHWVPNLTAPTGMALSDDNRLVVADVNEVLVIDTADGSVVNQVTVTGASNLQDIVVRNVEDRYYVSDMDTRRIYRGYLGGATAQSYRYSNELLGVNALWLTNDEDYLYAGACNQIFSINVDEDGPLEDFITPPDNFCVDGLARIYGSMFIISSQTTRKLYAVDTNSQHGFLSELNVGMTPGYIYIYIDSDDTYYLYVPTMEGNEVRAYRVTADYS